MNKVFFACTQCKALVDAGYRWATSTLGRSGVVSRGLPFDPQRVLAVAEFWSPDGEDSDWLRIDVLPRARAFLEAHASHELVFGDEEEIMGVERETFLDWLDLSIGGTSSPRHFAETLGLMLWVDVVALVRKSHAPWWWHDEELVDAARRRFNQLVERAGAKS